MKMALIILALTTSITAMASDITDHIPLGKYQGKNSKGDCWVSVGENLFGDSTVSISYVPPSVSPGYRQSTFFSDTTYTPTRRNNTPEKLTISYLIIPNDSYSRKEEVKLTIQTRDAESMVRIDRKEKFLGMWVNKHHFTCTINK